MAREQTIPLAGDREWDGHTTLFGMDAETEPRLLDVKSVHRAINRTFRGGRNSTRPAFRALRFHFVDPEDEWIFRFGNLQGAMPYKKNRPGRFDGIVVSIAGRIFFVHLVNENAYVYRIFRGNNPRAMQAWMIQCEEWVYIQDGQALPIFWDGLVTSTPRRSKGAEGREMPIGTIMCYAHGRVHVSNAYNQIASSDVMFGRGFTNTKNVQNFTENRYWTEGGYFSIPISEYGPIGGMIVMPAFGTNLRGQGELVVMGSRGAMTLDVSQPRLIWKDAQIQKSALIGRGCVAPDSLIAVNGDAWYRSDDGWSTYTNSQIDLQRKGAFRKFSREVNYWLDRDTDELLRYASAIFFDNRIIGTVSPQLSLTRTPENDEELGSHRYHRGMIALDLDKESGLRGGDPINFDGLWTGIRPTALVRMESRALAFSLDSDGENRLYEITKLPGLDNGTKKVRSHYITRRMTAQPTGASEFVYKRLVGGEIWPSKVVGRSRVSIDYKTNNGPDWFEAMAEKQVGQDRAEPLPFLDPVTKRLTLGSPDDECQNGELSNTATEFQFRVNLEGNCEVNDFRAGFKRIKVSDRADCSEEPEVQVGEKKPREKDFEYLIVE